MINAPPQLEFLNKLTNWLNIIPNKFSLLRIIIWTLAFLIVAHVITPKVDPQLPYQDEMNAVGLTPVSASTSDPRYTRNDLQPLPENSIIWVAGSSITIKETPDSALTFLPAALDIDNPQYISLKMARRALDTYTLVDDAISRKPSALVVIVNPFWALNDNSLFFKNNVMNSGARHWLNKDDWTLLMLMTSPADRLWARIGRHHNLTANSYDYLKLAQRKYLPNNKASKPKASKSKKISYNQPLLFWSTQRYAEGKDFSNFGAKEWQIEAMNQNNLTQSVWGQKLLTQMLDKIKASDIPTLIYVAPVSPEIERSPARVAYRTVTHQLRDIMAPYQSEKIVVINDFLPSELETLEYIDYLHLSDSGVLPASLTEAIQRLLEEK